MKHIIGILALGCFTLANNCLAADAPQFNVQLTGLRVVAPVNGGKNERGAFFSSPGVAVAVTITPANGKIISIDQFESKLESFKDDKGTDLLAVKSDDPFNKPGFERIQTEFTNATMEIQAAGLPAKGATVLVASGKLLIKIATGTKQSAAENVTIEPNTQFTLGDLPLKISQAKFGKSAWSDKQEFSVIFTSNRDPELIAALDLIDATGAKIEGHRRSWGGGMGSYEMEYVFPKQIDRAKIVATCWENLKEIEAPISVKAGIGL